MHSEVPTDVNFQSVRVDERHRNKYFLFFFFYRKRRKELKNKENETINVTVVDTIVFVDRIFLFPSRLTFK